MKLTLGYFYPKLLNLYGDNGNVEILKYRAQQRGYDVEVIEIDENTVPSTDLFNSLNMVFMGGGPDSSQKSMYEDLLNSKGSYLKEYVENGGVGLYICGAYQLLGHYYKSASGSVLEGLSIFDIYTQHFGNHKPRCIGNVVCSIDENISYDSDFKEVNHVGETLVGFENHGGRTFLGKGVVPLGKVIKGHGNNGEDNTEGAVYRNSIGTYLHGPVLSKNPHLADFLILKSLELEFIDELDDTLIIQAHAASKKLR